MGHATNTDSAATPRRPSGRRVLYIAYWGLLEPLGQSLVAPAVVGLAQRGFEIDLITFDKPSDLQDARLRREMRDRLRSAGVRWVALRYHKRLKALSKPLDLLLGTGVGLWLALFNRPDIIHGRTFIGGLVACAIATLTRRPWIYHAEGFWPEQQVEGGYWRRDSVVFRVTRRLDRWLYGRASGAILLSRRSRPLVEALPAVAARRTPLVIVPSCVDLAGFPPIPSRRRDGRTLRLVYVGSLGGRYLIEPLGELLKIVRQRAPGAHLEILSHSDARPVTERLDAVGVPREAWGVRRVAHSQIPSLLADCDAGLHFLAPGPGALSCSPTKIGEYWACGLPVVTTDGVGDIDEIIRERRVGVLVPGCDATTLTVAAGRLLDLLNDPALRSRCRVAAQEHYSLERALAEQEALYRAVCRIRVAT